MIRPELEARAVDRAHDLLWKWADNLAGIQVGPADTRVALLEDAPAALEGATGSAGAEAYGNEGTLQAVAGYFLMTGRERSEETGAFYQHAFIARRPRPPHPLRPDFTTAVGNAALKSLRAYVNGQLDESSTALSDEEKAGIRTMVAEAKFVMSGDVGRFAGLRTREPDHAYFKPKSITPQDDGTLKYTTESGQTFFIEETADGLPTRVVGENLTRFIGRGVTQDSPYFTKDQDFNRAHVIANEFGGSGYRSGRNLVTTSDHYNKELMRGAEIKIGTHIDTKAGDDDTRVRATMPPQAAVVRFSLAVALAYVDALILLIEDAILRNRALKDKHAKVRENIKKELLKKHIDKRLKRVKHTKYELTDLVVAGKRRTGTKTQIGQDTWLLRESP